MNQAGPGARGNRVYSELGRHLESLRVWIILEEPGDACRGWNVEFS